MSLDGEMNVLTLYYKGCRCVQVALAYNDLQKIPESLALYDRAQGYVVQAKQGLSQIRQFDSDALLTVSQQDITTLEQSIRAGTWKSRAAWYLEHGNSSEEAMEQKMQQLDLNNEGEALVNQLDTYPSHISQDRLVDFPPKLQPVACKPFYFDLAANFVKYPEQSLAERTGKQNTGGSGFWGIFGGRK
jgi:signal recognition particle subunit SRP68